jgi:hypothetical protein
LYNRNGRIKDATKRVLPKTRAEPRALVGPSFTLAFASDAGRKDLCAYSDHCRTKAEVRPYGQGADTRDHEPASLSFGNFLSLCNRFLDSVNRTPRSDQKNTPDFCELHPTRVPADILDISPANFRKQLSRAKADLFQFMEHKCGLINPNNPCRCYKKTKGFIREGKVDALTQQFIPKVTETIDSIVGRKNEELDVLMEGKYLGLFRSQPFYEEDLVEKVLEDEDVRKLFQLD